MKIDQVSKNIILLALYLNKKNPGLVPEIWLDRKLINSLKKEIPKENNINQFVQEVSQLISQIKNKRRKIYLTEILHSLEFQINNDDAKINYSQFTKNVFGYQINRVTEKEIGAIENSIQRLENKAGTDRYTFFRNYNLATKDYKKAFANCVKQVKSKVSSFIIDYPDKGFNVEVTTKKPWGAYNSHIAPFKSQLILNKDAALTKLDLYKLASHEAYGGHHSELSQKDKLLIKKGYGEHGLVILYSPQTFVSEAIAEGMYVLLGIIDKNNIGQIMDWYYARLSFALQNKATFMYFDDGLSREEIKIKLKKYGVTAKRLDNILNFSTDKIFGRYAPIYYSAYNFICDLYNNTDKKKELIKTLFTEPCTPKVLMRKFI